MSFFNFTSKLFIATSIMYLTACGGTSDSTVETILNAEEAFEIVAVPTQNTNAVAKNLEMVSVSFNKAVVEESVSVDQIRITPSINYSLDKSLLKSRRMFFLMIKEQLAANQSYRFEINGIQELDSGETQNFTWTYSTKDDSDLTAPSLVNATPAQGSSNVSDKLSQVQFIFDESISPLTNNNISTVPAISGNVNVTGSTLKFSPSSALRANQNYTMTISGVSDSFGNVSDDIIYNFETGADTASPSAPGGLRTTNVSDTSISIQWNASTDNTALANYRVMRGIVGGSLSLLTTTTNLSFTDNSVNPSTNYLYQIVAVDTAGNTNSGNQLGVTSLAQPDNTPPSAPGGLTTSAAPTSSNVQLSWNASSDNIGVNGYRVNRRLSGGSWQTLVASQASTSFNDTTVSANSNYQYQVFAFDASGNESASIILDVTTPAFVDTTSPSFSANLRTSSAPTSTSVSIQWNAASDNVAVSGYRVMRSINGATAAQVADVTGLNFTNSSLSASTNYSYQVFAYDAAGNDTGSNILAITTPALMAAINDTYSTPFETALNANLSSNDTQSPNSPTTWELVSQAASGTAVVNANGSFSYTPVTGFSGPVSFTYRMRDSLSNFSNTATASITVQAQQAASACGTLYANNGGYTPVTNRFVVSLPALAKPAKGNHYIDADYGTCVVRVTDHANDSNLIANRAVPDYSRRQVFNADQSRMLLQASDGYWHLYDANDYSHIRRVSLQGGSVEFQWHPTNPDLLYRMAFNGGRQIYLHDVSDASDSTVSTVGDFTNVVSIDGYPGFTSINQVWPNATRFSTGEEGSPSKDGRYWALMAMSGDFSTQYGIIVYDLQTDTIVGVYDYASDGGGIGGPNNISMSPSGTHVVALWNPPACQGGLGTLNSPCGTMAFNKNFTSATGIAINGEHGDTATDINGRDVYVGIEYQSRGAIEVIDLETGNLVADIETQVWVGGAVHISGRAYNKPGWVVISHYTGNSINTWYNEEIFLAKLDTNPVIVRLAKHRSNSADYWSQPHATLSRDASKIVWGSNWNGSVLNLDTYMVTLPAGTLDGL